MKKFFLILMINFLAAEKTSAQSTQTDNSLPGRTDSAIDKIAFITLKIKKVADSFSVTLSDIKIVEGVAKLQRGNSGLLLEGDLVCFVTDDKNIKTDTIVISHPLTRRYEYPGENGVIGTKVVNLDETEITLRSAYKPTMKYLRIESIKADKKVKRVATLSLN